MVELRDNIDDSNGIGNDIGNGDGSGDGIGEKVHAGEDEQELPCVDYRLSNAEAANVAASPPFFIYPGGAQNIPDTSALAPRMDKLWDEAVAASAVDEEEVEQTHLGDSQGFEGCSGLSSTAISTLSPPTPSPPPLKVYGREIIAQNTSPCGGLARFDFDMVCGDTRPLGPADYTAIAQRYHTVFVDDVPAFHMFNRHLSRRLIWLVDALYEARANLVASAATAPFQLFRPPAASASTAVVADVMVLESLGSLSETATGRFALADSTAHSTAHTPSNTSKGSLPASNAALTPDKLDLFTGAEDVFAFERCASRLMEMQTPSYRSMDHRPALSLNSVSGSLTGFGGMPDAPPPLPVEEADEDEDEGTNGVNILDFCLVCVCVCLLLSVHLFRLIFIFSKCMYVCVFVVA